MLDIVSHRVSIGRFHHSRLASPNRQTCLKLSNPPFHSPFLTLLTLAMVASMMAAASVKTSPLDCDSPNSSPIFTNPRSMPPGPLPRPPPPHFWPPHPPPSRPAPRLPTRLQNKAAHILNGNRKGIKLSHWNLGSAQLQNKMCELEIAVKQVKPALLGVSEANLHRNTDLSLVQLPGYSLLTASTLTNPRIQMSRVVVYLGEGLHGKLREDLMSDDFSSIWVELIVPGQSRKILVSNIYRDHQWMNQGEDKSSKSDKAVMSRWRTYLQQWERALESGAEVHSMGDFNLDSGKLDSNSGRQQPLVDALLQQVVPLGVTQCAPAATWTPQGGQRGQPAGLDHYWTNRPEKLSQVQALTIGYSDHKLISAVRLTKVLREIGQKYVRKRKSLIITHLLKK